MAFSHPGARERPPREKIYKEAAEKSKDLISKRFPKMMEVLLFLCVDPGHFLSTTSFFYHYENISTMSDEENISPSDDESNTHLLFQMFGWACALSPEAHQYALGG